MSRCKPLSICEPNVTGTNVPANTNNVTIGSGTLVCSNSATVDQSPCKDAPLTLTFSGS